MCDTTGARSYFQNIRASDTAVCRLLSTSGNNLIMAFTSESARCLVMLACTKYMFTMIGNNQAMNNKFTKIIFAIASILKIISLTITLSGQIGFIIYAPIEAPPSLSITTEA